MTEQFDFLIFIGRFQPLHRGHLAVIEQGLRRAEHLIVLCGSAHQPRSVRNPWLADERAEMILAAVPEADRQRLSIAPLMDRTYNNEAWVHSVQATVNGLVTAHFHKPHNRPKIGLIGHNKDQTSYYLHMFPQWGTVDVQGHPQMDATQIRTALFAQNPGFDAFLRGAVAARQLPACVIDTLRRFCKVDDFQRLVAEQEFITRYRESWSCAPYEPTFVTVDAVVVQSGHVLMVERKARPGKGHWALPGGFVDSTERLLDACIRELKEETRIKVPVPVLRGSIKHQAVFDDPHRSARGRTITHAFYIELSPDARLPKVKGSDDAKRAAWIPFADLDPRQIFEDHYFIIQEMSGM